MLHVASDTEFQRNRIEISPHQFDEKQKDYNRLIQHLNKCKKTLSTPSYAWSFLPTINMASQFNSKIRNIKEKFKKYSRKRISLGQQRLETENNLQISCLNADVFPTQPLHGRHPV